MLQTKSIRPKELVAVSFDVSDIYLRKSGKSEFGKEELLCGIQNNTLVVNMDIAKKYGLDVQINDGE